eukprot:symbB.v1.2.010811.t1/scaffold712.1/size170421/10
MLSAIFEASGTTLLRGGSTKRLVEGQSALSEVASSVMQTVASTLKAIVGSPWVTLGLLVVIMIFLLIVSCWSLAMRESSTPMEGGRAAAAPERPNPKFLEVSLTFFVAMAVLLETNLGDIVIDLKVDHAPRTCLNFLKLCKMKYYNNCLFLSVDKDYITRTGDPTNTGRGGCCVHAKLPGLGHRYFKDEIHPGLKHNVRGTVGMANEKPNENGSQFYITLRKSVEQLDEKHTIFGRVAEGFGVPKWRASVRVSVFFVKIFDLRFFSTAFVVYLLGHLLHGLQLTANFHGANATASLTHSVDTAELALLKAWNILLCLRLAELHEIKEQLLGDGDISGGRLSKAMATLKNFSKIDAKVQEVRRGWRLMAVRRDP